MPSVALISEHASPLARPGAVDNGGQNVYVAHVARHLANSGHRVDVFTRRDGPLPEVVQWHPRVRVIHVPAGPPHYLPKEDMLPFMDAFAEYMLGFARRQRQHYDAVHANFFMSGKAALPLCRALSIPLVITFHALGRVRRLHQREADRFPPSRFAIEEELVRCADRIIAECPADHADLVQHYGADPRRIDIVPCGFDASEFAPTDRAQARAALGWDPATFSILQLGRMVPRKGVDNVIRALALLRRTHGVAARLYVVGGESTDPARDRSPELARLRHLAQAEGLAHAVQFVGRRDRDQLATFYGAADVFVSTPWYEPFGITPVEAMACARPVVGSDVGGIRYSVLDGDTGFLVPPNDPAALAQRLALLAARPELGRRLGTAGLRRARGMFTWRLVARQLARIYADCQRASPAERPMAHAIRARLSAGASPPAVGVRGASPAAVPGLASP
ncbi:glycosyltransferase family 1 protein [Verticiella sediminum]|uniref:Glycosyltransferase family 1 protein n=1 Tax=Verticiella sediminum TaxID=1247510 RepID=A0A556AF63_9BURK|nr:glycosyltransferase [Verticiella sediminum]TSH91515.1 glycosyltransferase family 1 protein [Verticiella sediminum]